MAIVVGVHMPKCIQSSKQYMHVQASHDTAWFCVLYIVFGECYTNGTRMLHICNVELITGSLLFNLGF